MKSIFSKTAAWLNFVSIYCEMADIQFFTEKITFSVKDPEKVKKWLQKSVNDLGKRLSILNYIFTTDDNLLSINKLYLNHDYFTDIITFDNSDADNQIEGDIFISVDRVRENAKRYNTSFEKELARVMIHGVLHLAGYNDRTEEEKKWMRKLEDQYLSWLNET